MTESYAFLIACDAYAEGRITVDDMRAQARAALASDETLSADACDALDVPRGSTVGQAAQTVADAIAD